MQDITLDHDRTQSGGSRHTSVPVALVAALALLLSVCAVVVNPFSADANTGSSTGFGATDGGAGGSRVSASTGTAIHEALCNRPSDSTPIIIEVSGRITIENTKQVSGPSCNTKDGVIELKEVANVSLIGTGNAVFDGVGIHVRSSSDIVIQNVTVRNVRKSGGATSNGGDAIGMESGVRNVWIDHVTLEASGGESEGFDSLFDIKRDVDNVTVSYSIFRNSGRGGLVGSSESDTSSTGITYHHNMYDNIESRAHLIRGAQAHMFNNYFRNISKSGINSRAGAQVLVENNYFENSKDVLGTFYTTERGTYEASGNLAQNVSWSDTKTENYPAGDVNKSTGSVSVPYGYKLDPASCLKNVVVNLAGADKGNRVSSGCDGGGVDPAPVTTQPPAPVTTQPPAPDTTKAPAPTSTEPGPVTTEAPVVTQPPTPETTEPPAPTTTQPGPVTNTGKNLSIGAGSDGSSKASGTSYKNVRDGKTGTYWSPRGNTGRVSIKWGSHQSVASVAVRGENIGSWDIVNHDTGQLLASGQGAGSANFSQTTLRKINLVIKSSNGTPRVTEFETYGGSTTVNPPPVTTTTAPGPTVTKPPVVVTTEAPPAPTTTKAPVVTTTPPTNSGITGASCRANGSRSISSTIRVEKGQTFDGNCQVFNPSFGDGSQSESQDPVFRVEDGGTLKNVIIGYNGADGVHTYGDVTVDNVTWLDVGEDALTIKGEGYVTVRNIEGYDASDKFFQVNAPSTLRVENCIIENAGKALRQNGGKTFKIDVAFNRCSLKNLKEGVFRSDSPSAVASLTNSKLSSAKTTCIGPWARCNTSGNSGS